MQDPSAQANHRLLHPRSEQSWHGHRLLPSHNLYLGEYLFKSLASAGWQNLPPMETFAQKGSLSAPVASLEKKQHPLMKLQDFSDAIPDEAQQGTIPRQSVEMRLAAARRQPCASQPAQKFTVGSGSELCSYVITGSAVVIRIVRLESVQLQAEIETEQPT